MFFIMVKIYKNYYYKEEGVMYKMQCKTKQVFLLNIF